MKRFKHLTVALLASALLTGCAMQPTPQEAISKSMYKELTIEMMKNYPIKDFLEQKDKYSYAEYKENFIEIATTINQQLFRDVPPNRIVYEQKYAAYDSIGDELSRIYIANAKANGNNVKLYKGILGSKMANMLPLPPSSPKKYFVTNLDNVMIEFTKDNRIVSVHTRVHSMYPASAGLHSSIYAMFYFGDLARKVENNISNKLLEETFIKDL